MTRDIEWSHSVTVSVAVPYGRRAFRIPFSEVERFKLDQIGVAAQLLDMPREDYVRWVEQEGSVQVHGDDETRKTLSYRLAARDEEN